MCYHMLLQYKPAIDYYKETLETMKDLDYQYEEDGIENLKECITRILMCFNGYGKTPLALDFYEKFYDVMQIIYSRTDSDYLKFLK